MCSRNPLKVFHFHYCGTNGEEFNGYRFCCTLSRSDMKEWHLLNYFYFWKDQKIGCIEYLITSAEHSNQSAHVLHSRRGPQNFSLIIYSFHERRNPVNLQYFNSEIKPTFPKQTRAEVCQAGNLRHRRDEFFKQPHNTRSAKQKIQNVCIKKGNIHGKLSKYNLHPKSWR